MPNPERASQLKHNWLLDKKHQSQFSRIDESTHPSGWRQYTGQSVQLIHSLCQREEGLPGVHASPPMLQFPCNKQLDCKTVGSVALAHLVEAIENTSHPILRR